MKRSAAAAVRCFGVLIWIVEAIGLLNLISVPSSPRPGLMYFSRHADVNLEILSISSAIVALCTTSALLCRTFRFFSFCCGSGVQNSWGGIVISRCGCIITVHAVVTYRYIYNTTMDSVHGLGRDGSFNWTRRSPGARCGSNGGNVPGTGGGELLRIEIKVGQSEGRNKLGRWKKTSEKKCRRFGPTPDVQGTIDRI